MKQVVRILAARFRKPETPSVCLKVGVCGGFMLFAIMEAIPVLVRGKRQFWFVFARKEMGAVRTLLSEPTSTAGALLTRLS